mmetsp:Transcript_3198/g.4534  ORF Transcript_3198/g.4534 Transcript_3198/m.4534 type:complete len:574 (+) Transcript_3198:190-1911(+)
MDFKKEVDLILPDLECPFAVALVLVENSRLAPPFLEMVNPATKEPLAAVPVLNYRDSDNVKSFPETCRLLSRRRPFFPYMSAEPFMTLSVSLDRRPQLRDRVKLNVFRFCILPADLKSLQTPSHCVPDPRTSDSDSVTSDSLTSEFANSVLDTSGSEQVQSSHPEPNAGDVTACLQWQDTSRLIFWPNGDLLTKSNLNNEWHLLAWLFKASPAAQCGLQLLPRSHQTLLQFNLLTAFKPSATDPEETQRRRDFFAVKLELLQFSYSNPDESAVLADVLTRNTVRTTSQVHCRAFLQNSTLRDLYVTVYRQNVPPFQTPIRSISSASGDSLPTFQPRSRRVVNSVVTRLEEQFPESPWSVPSVPKTDLFESLQTGSLQHLDRKALYSVVIWTVVPVAYMHRAHWAHNDVSLENYLFHQNAAGEISVQLFDFGAATKVGSFEAASMPFLGKPGYRPFEFDRKNESLSLGGYDRRKSDVFALGALIHYAVLGVNTLVLPCRNSTAADSMYQILLQQGWAAFASALKLQSSKLQRLVDQHYDLLEIAGRALDADIMTRITSEQLLGSLFRHFLQSFT